VARPRLLKTFSFRLALLYVVLFAASVSALLAFVYWNTARFMARQTDQTLEAEIDGLKEQFERRGFAGLLEVVSERSRDARESYYLVTDPARRPLAGNLSSWPAEARQDGMWIDFEIEFAGPGAPGRHPVRAREFVIRGPLNLVLGYLLVGRDIDARRKIENMITGALYWAGAMTLGLGLVGGIVMSRNMVRRLEAINRTSRQIMGGDFSRRVPLTGSGDELDQLAADLNAMLDQIERLMQAMQNVTNNIAHDLRSPLNRLRARIEVTLMRPPDANEFKRVLEETVIEADGLLATFNALLDIARIESAAESHMAVLDPTPLVRDIADLYEPACEAKGHRFGVEISDGLNIEANRELLSRALSNLLDNAVKYTEPGGEIGLSLKGLASGEVEIAVTDTGPGIPPLDRERVLQRFVRLSNSVGKPGSGLGLSLVAAVARLHRACLALDERGGDRTGLRARLVFPAPGSKSRFGTPRAAS